MRPSVKHSPPVQPSSSITSGTGSVSTMWDEVTLRRERSSGSERAAGPTASTAVPARTRPPAVSATTPPPLPFALARERSARTCERSKTATPRSIRRRRRPRARRAGCSVAKSGTLTPRRNSGAAQVRRTWSASSATIRSGAPSSAAASTAARPTSSNAGAVETQT